MELFTTNGCLISLVLQWYAIQNNDDSCQYCIQQGGNVDAHSVDRLILMHSINLTHITQPIARWLINREALTTANNTWVPSCFCLTPIHWIRLAPGCSHPCMKEIAR